MLLGIAGPASMATAGATEVIGDDERDMFIGTGSLILPIGVPGRGEAADCPGCAWKATLACDPVSPTACRGQARLCPDDHLWLRIWLRHPGEDWRTIGSECFGPGGPATRTRIEIAIHDKLQHAIPALSPTSRPGTGVLPHLPVAFHSGQEPGSRHWDWDILGIRVSVIAQPRWTWQFDGDSSTVGTYGVPLAEGPRMVGGAQAMHTYRTSGVRQVRVSATWIASYSASGLVGLQVEQPVSQSASLPIRVGEARAVLFR